MCDGAVRYVIFVLMYHNLSTVDGVIVWWCGCVIFPLISHNLSTVANSSRCNAPIDLVFVVDKSASIHDDQYLIEKDFVEKMIGKYISSVTYNSYDV